MYTLLLGHITGCPHCLDAVSRKPEPLDETGCPVFRGLFQGSPDAEASRKSLSFLQYHATDEAVEDYCFGRMAEQAGPRFRGHLSVCEDCRRHVEEHQDFVAYLKYGLQSESGVAGK
jgi:hypothetical protein